MFKKENKDTLDLTNCRPTETLPFTVVFEDQDPEKLENITPYVSTYDNIIAILEKSKNQNMNSRSIPQPKYNHEEEDIPDYRPSVILARAIVSSNERNGRVFRDKETGEIINTRNLTTNRSLSSISFFILNGI